MENLKIGEKITKVPLIQGGMGVGISLGRLAGSVAKAGGIGVISTAQIGYREPDFDKHPEEANLRAIGKEMQKARQISENGIIGYNIMTALKGYADHVKAAVKAGADLIISGAGLPVDLPALTEGSAVKIAPIVSTARSAQVILKYWDKKYGRTADLIVAEGPLAGGHLGFTEAELDKWKGDAYHMEFGNILDQGNRFKLINLLIAKNDRKAVNELFAKFKNEDSAQWDYFKALYYFKNGNLYFAKSAIKDGVNKNKYIGLFLMQWTAALRMYWFPMHALIVF